MPDTKLDFFEQHDRQKLMRYLASNAAWQVQQWSEGYNYSNGWGQTWKLGAMRRTWNAKCGWTNDISSIFWLEPPTEHQHYGKRHQYRQSINSNARSLKIDVYQEFSKSQKGKINSSPFISLLRVVSRQQSLQLEIEEVSEQKNRAFTINQLKRFSQELS